MRARISSLLKTPVFEDREQKRIADVLHPILVGLVGLVLVLAASLAITEVAPNPLPVLLTDMALMSLALTCIWLLRTGRVQTSALIFSSVLWVMLTLITLFYGGVSSATIVTYLVVTPLTGFFWGKRALIGFSCLSSVVALGMVFMEYSGTLPEPLSPMTPLNSWLSLVASLIVISLLLSLSIRSTDEALAESHQNEQAHREAEERFRGLLEQSPDALFIHADGELLYGNPAFARLVGADDAAQLLGANTLDLFQFGARPEERSRTREIIDAEGPARLTPDRWRRRDASSFPVEVSASKLRFADREAVQVIARDVSEREKLEDQLRQAQKMEAVGQFAGGIAHDFNNMLTAISGHNDFLLRSLPPGEQHDDAKEIERAAARAAELVKQLLAFGRRQVLQPVVLDLNEAIRSTESMLSRLLVKNIEFDARLSKNLGFVKVDPVQVEQVLMNLTVNARDSMPGGGRITLETRNVQASEIENLDVDGLEPGAYVSLVVTDTGAGMDEQTQARIFDPFFTTKGRFEGTGLGLSTVYGIVTQSGGAITVASRLGQGTTFKIYFPQCVENVDEARLEQADCALGGLETVLVAEDNAAVRRLTVRFLTEAGYFVLEAANGTEALALAERRKERIDLLLTDVVMPELGGSELTSRIKSSHPETRVLYFSGYPDDAIGHQGVIPHETAFLSKPFSSEDLANKVREVLDAD